MTIETLFLGRTPYAQTYERMREFTALRTPDTPDALWICEHDPVYTLGLAAHPDHLIAPGAIAVVATDRGGQVTYHGPGQVVAYALIDLKRAGYYVKEYVYRLEEALLRTLNQFGVTAHRVRGAPGIYVDTAAPFDHRRLDVQADALGAPGSTLAKIAALGLKMSRHCSYHGVALNVAMDLEPFSRINPCGYAGLKSTDLFTIGVSVSWDEAAQALAQHLQATLTP